MQKNEKINTLNYKEGQIEKCWQLNIFYCLSKFFVENGSRANI